MKHLIVVIAVASCLMPTLPPEEGCPDRYYADFNPPAGGWICVLSEFESVVAESGYP